MPVQREVGDRAMEYLNALRPVLEVHSFSGWASNLTSEDKGSFESICNGNKSIRAALKAAAQALIDLESDVTKHPAELVYLGANGYELKTEFDEYTIDAIDTAGDLATLLPMFHEVFAGEVKASEKAPEKSAEPDILENPEELEAAASTVVPSESVNEGKLQSVEPALTVKKPTPKATEEEQYLGPPGLLKLVGEYGDAIDKLFGVLNSKDFDLAADPGVYADSVETNEALRIRFLVAICERINNHPERDRINAGQDVDNVVDDAIGIVRVWRSALRRASPTDDYPRRITADEWGTEKRPGPLRSFPKLDPERNMVTGPAGPYDCIYWTMGRSSSSAGFDTGRTVDVMHWQYYDQNGYWMKEVNSLSEANVLFYGIKPNAVTHAARRYPEAGFQWSSKLGKLERVAHDPQDLEESLYGWVQHYILIGRK